VGAKEFKDTGNWHRTLRAFSSSEADAGIISPGIDPCVKLEK
jgi:hypothetical protein